MKNWLLRAICITPILIGLALIIKTYMVEPYGVTTILEFELKADRILRKGDREI